MGDVTLRDIHLPTHDISWWPPAPAWWVLLALLILLTGAVCWQAVRYYRQRQQYRIRHQLQTFVMRQLADIRQQYQQRHMAGEACAQASVLLRRACLYAFEQQAIASLYGQAWLDVLTTISHWPARAGKTLIEGCYNPVYQADERDVLAMLDACERCLLTLLSPKKDG